MQPQMVPPGLETGTFYIPIANLPFDTNWRQFKDWLREGCVVDHVQIFGPSTSGWIRVMGQHNFHGACNRLKEGVFHGRRIMFDDRNISSPIMIKDVEVNENSASTQARSQRHESALGYQQAGPYPYDSYPGASYPQWDPNTFNPSQGYYNSQQPVAWYDGHSGMYPASPDQTVITEQRRIVVSRIGRNTSDDQIRAFIQQSTSSKSELQRIDIPRGSNNQRKGGHAFATFRTPDTALSAVKALDGKSLSGHEIEARLTNEGIAQGQSQNPGFRPTKKSGDPSKKKRSNEKSKSLATSSSSSSGPSGESSSSHQSEPEKPKEPVVACGTTHHSKSGSKEWKG
ncbi:hypothetical protein BDP55DRAFT_146157 [Colletotrichum godetiae]|uniref:RRM domain-containing protein n=1 Tax=Colletotrichum godetiae TaxID=1209918 RepID=A0AAJ0AKN7_9PEZI|nr:uncharacterized protein BDP55DRAFT_146157 [Colletotrichum godetiae]KAK1675649.1 hypothetical protein BDP55DRAFT_146157 [Colletotrichum godetiae]